MDSYNFDVQKMAHQARKRHHLLQQLCIEEIPTVARCVPISEYNYSPAPTSSRHRYFIDENENEYLLKSSAAFAFNNLLDSLTDESLDTAKEKVREFLSPFEQSKKDS